MKQIGGDGGPSPVENAKEMEASLNGIEQKKSSLESRVATLKSELDGKVQDHAETQAFASQVGFALAVDLVLLLTSLGRENNGERVGGCHPPAVHPPPHHHQQSTSIHLSIYISISHARHAICSLARCRTSSTTRSSRPSTRGSRPRWRTPAWTPPRWSESRRSTRSSRSWPRSDPQSRARPTSRPARSRPSRRT